MKTTKDDKPELSFLGDHLKKLFQKKLLTNEFESDIVNKLSLERNNSKQKRTLIIK